MIAPTDTKQDSCTLQRANGLLLVTNTPKGRGVFASQYIARGTVVDISPVLVFTQEEVQAHTSKTCLQHYTYYWPSPHGGPQTQAMALGLGSMFNHSRLQQNVIWKRDLTAETIVYMARRDIEAGEELCISYGNARLWFKDADVDDDDSDLEDKDELVRSGLAELAILHSNDSAEANSRL